MRRVVSFINMQKINQMPIVASQNEVYDDSGKFLVDFLARCAIELGLETIAMIADQINWRFQQGLSGTDCISLHEIGNNEAASSDGNDNESFEHRMGNVGM